MKKILIAILLCLCIGAASPLMVACGPSEQETDTELTEEVIQTVLDQLNEMTIYCYSEELATFSEARGAFIIDLGAEFAADADGLVEFLPEYLTSFNYSYILEDPCLVITILFE